MRRFVAQNKRPGRIFHLSAVIVHFVDPKTGIRSAGVRRPGTTYVGTRNRAETRITRQFRRARVRALKVRQAMEYEMKNHPENFA